MILVLRIGSNRTWLFIHCKFGLSLIWLRNCEIVHLLVSEVNLHVFMWWYQSLLMLHIGQILYILMEKLVVNHVRSTVHASWHTLTVEKGQLMIPLLQLRNFILIGLMLTVQRTQLTCCVVCNFWNLVWNLIYLRIFEILRLFITFTFWFNVGQFSTFPRPRRFRCFLGFLTSLLSIWWILKTNLDDTISKSRLRFSTIRTKVGDSKISFTLS